MGKNDHPKHNESGDAVHKRGRRTIGLHRIEGQATGELCDVLVRLMVCDVLVKLMLCDVLERLMLCDVFVRLMLCDVLVRLML